MTGKRVSETELMLPALYFINREPGITTTRLKLLLVDLLKPTGKDAEIARSRTDTYFEQYDDGEVVVSEPRFHIHAVGATRVEALKEFRRIL